MAKPTIAFYDAYAPDQAHFQEALGSDYKLVFTDQGLRPDTAHLAASATILSVHVSSQVTAGAMKQMPDLRHIACRSTGFDHVDLAYAKSHQITVSTVPGYGEATVAEYSFLLLLAVSRRLMRTAHATRFGDIVPSKLTGHDLAGKTLGIIGTGRIGRHAARIGLGFGMKVVAYDPYPNEAAARELGYEYLPLKELLARADCLTLHAPATPETHHLLGAREFAQMKPGAFIVNTARGELIDTPALIEALESGQVGGAGLDVVEGEEFLQISSEIQLLQGHHIDEPARAVLGIDTLTKMPNVLVTSHNAYNSAEALGRIRGTSVANILAFTAGKPENLVS
ncbi:MAG: D-isomer specific 2-hydroxyacid dehydrogenase, NAD-binding protein [Patescibacteria group bacterium]|nr:D-isomer specific 2-hydroxyacid dehydrogenase, NAD-binding protein [Patescibacteria group bacterium]